MTEIIDIEPSKLDESLPQKSTNKKRRPTVSSNNKDLPSTVDEKNCVIVDGIKVEIKPTAFKYFRNKRTNIYSLLKVIPINEFLQIPAGPQGLDPEKDGDQLMFDFLIAVFDDADFVSKHYNSMNAEIIDKIIEIFGRINGIDKRQEEARKNREAQMTH